MRLLAIALLVPLHLSIDYTMRVGWFSYVCIAGLTLFVPSSVWDWVSERWPTLHLGTSTSPAAQHSTPVDEGGPPRFFDRAADGDGSPVSITRNVRGHGRDFPDVREAYSPARQRRL